MSTHQRQDDSSNIFSPERVIDHLDTALTRFAGEMSRPGAYNPDMFHRNGFADLPNVSIDFNPRGHYNDRAQPRGHYVPEQHDGPSTARELGLLLMANWKDLDHGDKGNKLTSNEIYAYLGKHQGQLDPQSEKDLRYIADHMQMIGGKDGVISQMDLVKYMSENQWNDQLILMRREFEDRIRHLEEENARLRQGGKPTEHVEAPKRPGDAPPEHTESGISNINSPEQVAFRQKYGIPDNVDLTKFATGKANDGVVGMPPPNVGLMGLKDEAHPEQGRKWDDPNFHSAKYDTCRNLGQVIGYMDGLSEEQQKTFMEDFLKLQAPVIQADGYRTGNIYKESIEINGVKKDTVRALGAEGAPKFDQIQWIDV